jgi:hypothetical protein
LPAAVVVRIILAVSFFFETVQAQTYSVLYTGHGATNLTISSDGTLYLSTAYNAGYLLFSFAGGKETVLQRFTVPTSYSAEAPQGPVIND